DGDVFEFSPRYHDDGQKTVLGQAGKLNGEDVGRIILEQPACARFLVRQLFRYFLSEQQVAPGAVVGPPAGKPRTAHYDISVVVNTMLASNLFFSPYAFRQRIKSPVEYVLGSARAVVTGDISQQHLVTKLEALGQSLFAPPNVKGWPGAQGWINTST